MLDALFRLMGRREPPPVTRFAAAMMSRTVTVRTDKARRELDYAPIRSFDEGVAALAA